jgi:signal transduction histidine kinase
MGATWLLTGWALRPVEAITKRVEEINAAGSGDRVPVPPAHDEIGHLARTVNTMLDRLDGAAVAQRRFVADASHELRSPLAAIRTETEVALARPIDADWTEVGQHVLDETDRLEGLVTDLLVLARRDDGQAVEVVSGTTDVEEVVLAEAARRRRVPIDTARVLAGRVRARPGDVQRIVRHLLDNAARHARSTVWASVTGDGTDVLLAVDDDGEGVPGAERERIFERFARLDDARSRDHGGAGLGLAVVAALVRDLGGAVVVTDAPGGGARFEVRLPGAGDHVA